MIEAERWLLGGRYLLGELLGVGGTASVFEGEDLESAEAGHRVALKILHPHLGEGARARERFLGEAGAAESLRHPNIAAVRASGLHEAGGVRIAWIALDLVEGGSLAEHVAEHGPLPGDQAAAVLSGVLSALSVAHRAGLVHRDVSPANVLLHEVEPGGSLTAAHVRLVDFGLADVTGHTALGGEVVAGERSASEVAFEETTTIFTGDDRLTSSVPLAPGTYVVGNPHYLSPEHAQGRPVRAGGDIYQAGALLHFVLTGQPPYPREQIADVVRAHVSAPPPVPSALVASARPFDRVVTKAMTKTPVRRFRDAEEMEAALAGAVAQYAARSSAALVATGATDRAQPRDIAEDLGYLRADPAAEPVPAQQRGTAVGVVLALAAVAVVGGVVWAVHGARVIPESWSAPLGLDAAPSASASPAAPAPTVTGPATPSASRSAERQAPDAASTGRVPDERTASASSTPSVPPAGAVAVPALSGTLSQAEAALARAGLDLGSVRPVESSRPEDTVLDQLPAAEKYVARGTAVDLTVASGRNLVPQVAGLTVAEAIAALEAAGFTASTADPDVSSETVVESTSPAVGTVVEVGARVTALVQTDTPPSSPAAKEPR